MGCCGSRSPSPAAPPAAGAGAVASGSGARSHGAARRPPRVSAAGTGAGDLTAALAHVRAPFRAVSWSEGVDHCCAVDTDGGVHCAGSNNVGQQGRGEQRHEVCALAKVSKMPWPAEKVSCGHRFSVALERGGGAVCTWGRPTGHRLGRPTHRPLSHCVPGEIASFSAGGERSAVDVAAGTSFVIVLTALGRVFGWGSNGNAELGLGARGPHEPHPKLIPALSNQGIKRIACGDSHGVAEAQGRLLAWGSGFGIRLQQVAPMPDAGMRYPFRSLAAAGRCSFLADAIGQLWLWQGGQHDVHQISLPGEEWAVHVACGTDMHIALSEAGRLWDCSDPANCRDIHVQQPQLPLGLVPCGGARASRMALVNMKQSASLYGPPLLHFGGRDFAAHEAELLLQSRARRCCGCPRSSCGRRKRGRSLSTSAPRPSDGRRQSASRSPRTRRSEGWLGWQRSASGSPRL
eukprot:TRINITY_DN6895_c0_g1_i1.p1 TRINITY_DN6895_c0_g1~~TRINITY_DN6895_c0_g1_i1.p1  ORF type:complete len:461 (+),score=66.08 TRINITY_DN6895_c0_g1_i1:82-1464(+)